MRWLSQPGDLPVERLAAALLAAGVPVDQIWISEDPDQEDDEVGIGERLHVQSHSVETFFAVVESDSMRAVCQTDDVGAAVDFVTFYLGIRR